MPSHAFFARPAAALLAAWLCAWPAGAARAADDVLVFAAASLKDALDGAALEFERAGQGSVKLVYAASSTLAKQIERGAPADLFVSADLDWMDYLAARGRIRPESRANLASNRLALVAPRASAVEAKIAPGFPLASLLGGGRLALADPDHVPAGRYARAALETLGVWTEVRGRLAPAENVRAALALVARGEVPLGIVYRTDALGVDAVRVVGLFPADSHKPIVYPAALTSASKAKAATAFLSHLRSEAVQARFRRLGFDAAG